MSHLHLVHIRVIIHKGSLAWGTGARGGREGDPWAAWAHLDASAWLLLLVTGGRGAGVQGTTRAGLRLPHGSHHCRTAHASRAAGRPSLDAARTPSPITKP